MALQLALLIAGIALIVLVVTDGLFPAVGLKLKAFLTRGKTREARSNASSRESFVAPHQDTDDTAMLGEDELFDDNDPLYDVPLTNDSQFDPRSIEVEPFAVADRDQDTEQALDTPHENEPSSESRATFQEVLYGRAEEGKTTVNNEEEYAEVSSLPEEVVEFALASGDADDELQTIHSTENQAVEPESDEPDMHITPTETFTSLRQIDYWVKLACTSAQSLNAVRSKFSNLAGTTSLQQQTHVLNLQDKQWHALDSLASDAIFAKLVISAQLLVKGQPISNAELSHFVASVDQLAEEIGAQTQYLAPPAEAVIQSSNLASLYANCQGVIEATVSGLEGQPFFGKLIESSAKMRGLDYLDGSYVRIKQMGSRKVVLYRLLSSEGISFTEDMSSDVKFTAVKFVMHPARSEHPGRVVKEMLDSAQAFASRVRGGLTLFEGVGYHKDQLCQVRDQVSKIESKMEQAGLPAGCTEAVRLFSYAICG